MKFFVTSDIHSFYEPLKTALDNAGFDQKNEEHWLIVCGDVFDRGPDSTALLNFLSSVERKILIKGNHDILLEECCTREFPYPHDKLNGTVRTIRDLGGSKDNCFAECCCRTYEKLSNYRKSLLNYFETKNYIFVHSWIPIKIQYDEEASKPWYLAKEQYLYNENWREASEVEWEDAMWYNPFEMAEQNFNKTGKTLCVGHWHCSRGWAKKESRSEFGDDARWDVYSDDIQKVIFIDRCTAHTKEVNVLVLEDDFIGTVD